MLIFFSLILTLILISISIEDIKTMLISENKLFLLAGFSISYLVYVGSLYEKINIIHLIRNHFFSFLIIYIILYLIKYISSKLFRINSLGMGDIKLSSISALFLGIELSFISICIAFLLSALFSLHGKITKRFKIFDQYPFAPFISIGIIYSWILDKI